MKNKYVSPSKILLWLFISVFILSLSGVIFIILNNVNSDRFYDRLCRRAFTEGDTNYDTRSESSLRIASKSGESDAGNSRHNFTVPYINFSELKRVSKDIQGWLTIPGTPVDYPVTQGRDNSFYLHHLPDGTFSYEGTLFTDKSCHKNLSDFNTVIYGHNMRSGSMFGSLDRYKDPAYLKVHPFMFFVTPEKTYRIKIFAGFVTPAGSDVYSLNMRTRKEEWDFINKCIRRSCFDSEINPLNIKKIITLSTCDYSFSGARFVLTGAVTG